MTTALLFLSALVVVRAARAIRDLVDCIPNSNDVMVFF